MVNTHDYIGGNNHVGVEIEANQKIERRVMEHRNRFRRLIFNRYAEFLPLLINYTNKQDTAIDFLKLEKALRNNYNVVIGQARNNQIMILGYVHDTHFNDDVGDNFYLKHNRALTKENINFIVPTYLIPNEMLEITYEDGCTSGDFVVMRNKPVHLNNDYTIINHYCDELAEVTLSRFSLIMQAKFSKIFMSEVNDESINQFITKLFNGSPFMKMAPTFNPEENIVDLGSDYITNALVELKREYQNKISELSNFLGVNSLAVDKESGVSDEEAKSNRAFTTSNSNIYIRGRESIKKLNRRFDLNVIPYYDDEAVSKMNLMQTLKDAYQIENSASTDGAPQESDGGQNE